MAKPPPGPYRPKPEPPVRGGPALVFDRGPLAGKAFHPANRADAEHYQLMLERARVRALERHVRERLEEEALEQRLRAEMGLDAPEQPARPDARPQAEPATADQTPAAHGRRGGQSSGEKRRDTTWRKIAKKHADAHPTLSPNAVAQKTANDQAFKQLPEKERVKPETIEKYIRNYRNLTQK
jgi:hypothetical protein